MELIILPKRLFLDNRGSSIPSLVPFHKEQYDGLNGDDLIKAFVRNMAFALVTENFDEYEKHTDYMFALYPSNGIIRTHISLEVFEKVQHLRSINSTVKK